MVSHEENSLRSVWGIVFLVLGVAVLYASPVSAAVGTGGGLPYESWLADLRNSVTGPVAFTFSIVGIVIAGSVLIFGGELNGFIRSLVFIVLVMSFLVGAQNMMATFFGRGALIDSQGSNVAELFFAGVLLAAFARLCHTALKARGRSRGLAPICVTRDRKDVR